MSDTSVIVDVSTEDGGTSRTTSVVPVTPSSNTAPLPPSPSETTAEISTSTRVVPASSTAVVTPSSSTARITPSTSTGVSTVLVTSIVTQGGSTFTQTSSSASTSLVTTSATAAANNSGGGGGLSSTAKNAIIGSTVGVGGAIILGFLFFFLTRYLRKRKSDYTPGADDIRWPEEQQDTGMLFAPAVRQTGGAGLGREASMRSTVAGSITTAGMPAYSHRQPTIPEMGMPYEDYSDHSGAGLAAGAAGVGAVGGAAYYDHNDANNRYSYQPQQYPGYADPQDRQEYTYPTGYEASIRSQPQGPLRSTNHSHLDDVSHYGGR